MSEKTDTTIVFQPNTSQEDEMDSWFNDLDDKMVEIINNNLIKEEESSDNEFSGYSAETIAEPTEIQEYLYIEDIINKNSSELTSNEVIQYECSISYFVQVLMEGSNVHKIRSIKVHDTNLTFDKIKDIISYLSWISTASDVLSKKIGQELIPYYPEDRPFIVRSSYNFCTRYTQCKNFYSKHEKPTCKEHHYVHSLLKYDVDSVIAFLNYVIDDQIILNNEEMDNLYLSIKTICFVTRHMAKEISYIDYITKNNSETFHRNNPIDLNKKRVTVRKSFGESDHDGQRYRQDYKRNRDNYNNNNNSYNRRSERSYRQNFNNDSAPGFRDNRVSFKRKNSTTMDRKNSIGTTGPNRFAILSQS